ASFIGEINMTDAKVVAVEGPAVVLEAPLLGEVTANALDHRFSIGDAATLAFRPEHVALSEAAGPDQPDKASGRIQQVAFLGRTRTVHVGLGESGESPASSIIAAVFADAPLLGEGQTVGVEIKHGHAIALPSATDGR
ncbi:MAG: TOBE domain-containing protein, partial [Kiloniellales bacterium]|nr:TOBE domain-containing protein [Kiloniellales bacterium]